MFDCCGAPLLSNVRRGLVTVFSNANIFFLARYVMDTVALELKLYYLFLIPQTLLPENTNKNNSCDSNIARCLLSLINFWYC